MRDLFSKKIFIKPKFWDRKKISFWSVILLPLSLIYFLTSLIIYIFQDKKKFSIPVICVGNIYVGGTGKTPLAREIYKISIKLGKNPAFIKKNYRYLVDEIKMLQTTGKTFVNKDRTEAINESISNKNDLVILDDGFQDHKIKKDFSILCFNSNQLIGNGFIIPSGPLRENFSSIKKADCIIINGERNVEFEDKVKKISKIKKLPIFYSEYKIKNLEKFSNKQVIAFAGIGNPSNFFDLLTKNNIKIKRKYSFPDHYQYTQKDFDKILEEESEKIVTTEKDYYRMSDEQKELCDYIEIDLQIKNKHEFESLLKNSI